MRRTNQAVGVVLGTMAVALWTLLPLAAAGPDTTALRTAVTVDNIRAHQAALQAVADANGGIRTSGTPGYDASVDYVAETLQAAGYQVTVQPFDFPFFEELSTPVFEQVLPNPTVYPPNDLAGFFTMTFSGSGDVTASIQAVDVVIPPGAAPNTSTSGCEAADFAGFVAGNIALIQRGTCGFGDKALNAEAAGAAAVIVFNEGQPGRTDAFAGTLGGVGATIPVIGTSFAIGETLYNLSLVGAVSVRVAVDALSEIRATSNVLAETPTGREDRVVVVGAHLDSVPEGPGINDNGSGVATILEIAVQFAQLNIQPNNKVRFAFWGAEEFGLLGSQFYVDNLSQTDIENIDLNLNFDMLGSPNFVRFVYDGDGSATPVAGPPGSRHIEQVFLNYFASQGLATEPTAFDGRSDYGPFIDVGIPAGGLFSGAEGIKTPEQAAIYGGTAGLAYDPCYHQACDTFDNASLTALDQFSDAAAHAVLTFAGMRAVVVRPAPNQRSGQVKQTMDFLGPRLWR